MKVLITTSGTGSRLGELTKHLNKALVRVGKRPVISYIIDSYPKNTDFVITLGYKGEQVRDFLELAYPKRKFVFVTIRRYEGKGTSLGYSMLLAKKKLQSPFVFHACDTIIEGFKVPKLDKNWSVGMRFSDMSQYTSYDTEKGGNIIRFNKKGSRGEYAHVGLIGVYDYRNFWNILAQLYKKNPNDSSLNDVAVFSEMLLLGLKISAVYTNKWMDIGNLKALENARKNISDHFQNLDKVDEALFFINDFVIKFFSDPNKVSNRVTRGKILGNIVPRTTGVKRNFYRYEYSRGDTYSNVAAPRDFKSFLAWSKKNLWKKVDEVSDKKFIQICNNFYKNKTKERISKFLRLNKLTDRETIINGENVPSVKKLLGKINFKEISHGIQTKFHGDYVLENIIKTKNSYILLDWRYDFGGLLRSGDIYYDLAKLSHNLVVNHDEINKNNFIIKSNGKKIVCSVRRKKRLIGCEKVLDKFTTDEGLDLKRVKILRALIWLNMSPLHHYPFSLFLYYYGKYNLWKELKNT